MPELKPRSVANRLLLMNDRVLNDLYTRLRFKSEGMNYPGLPPVDGSRRSIRKWLEVHPLTAKMLGD